MVTNQAARWFASLHLIHGDKYSIRGVHGQLRGQVQMKARVDRKMGNCLRGAEQAQGGKAKSNGLFCLCGVLQAKSDKRG